MFNYPALGSLTQTSAIGLIISDDARHRRFWPHNQRGKCSSDKDCPPLARIGSFDQNISGASKAMLGASPQLLLFTVQLPPVQVPRLSGQVKAQGGGVLSCRSASREAAAARVDLVEAGAY